MLCFICGATAHFNTEDCTSGSLCIKHKAPNMMKVTPGICGFEDCSNKAKFNYHTCDFGAFCEIHKDEEMVEKKKKNLCEIEGCETRALFYTHRKGDRQNKYKLERCDKHKTAKMKSCRSVPGFCCQNEDCVKYPSFNFPDKRYGLYCADHKLSGMVNVKRYKCVKCNLSASFTDKGETRAKYCSAHRPDEWVSTNTGVCYVKDCGKPPTYKDEFSSKSCKDHKQNGMTLISQIKPRIKKIETSSNPIISRKISNFDVIIKDIYNDAKDDQDAKDDKDDP